MKLIAVIIIGVFTIATAIRVPTSWTEKKNGQTHNKLRASENALRTRPQAQIHNKVNRSEEIRHPNLKKPEAGNEFRASATLDEWKPVFPVFDTFMQQPLPFPHYRKYQKRVETSPLHKNYRDDATHEPSETEDEEPIQREKEKPLSVHEVPLDIPTRPVYPGEGQWAKRGRKHRPFVSKHVFTPPEREENEKRPDGYETFEKNKKLFEKQRHRFGHEKNEDEEEEEDDDDEIERQEFVPTKLYTQIRRSESEDHLPRLVEDPQLREVIKDSKIQTVYTEEGYEDLAYDHAGHEKTAEENEGFAEFDKQIERERKKSGKNVDSEAERSEDHVVKKPTKMKRGKLVKREEIKTTNVKKDDEDSEMEVSSEENVKIFPKVYRYDRTTPKTNDNTAKTQSAIKVNRKRRKRYTNDIPKIVIDTDFIDKINHDLPKIEKAETKPKYPYYNDPTVNPYSPLRYAEDLSNIPKKTKDDLAFYHQAEKIKCPEVQADVDPIPKRVKDANKDPENMEETKDVQELVQVPRLKNLGDRIDCFKVKYFGEDPLDSPFFKEKDIGPVIPLFKVFKKEKSDKEENETREKRKYSAKIPQKPFKDKPELKEEGLNILADVINQFDKSRESRETETTTVRPVLVENKTEASVITIITTPKYTIDLKPKHIYHQIELLEYLPHYSKSENSTNEGTTVVPAIDRVGKSMEEPTTASAPTEESPPESQALKHRRRPRPRRPYYQIFDVNQYLPKTTYSLLNRVVRTSTVLPRGATTDYKNDIKASEQLNVFADVINNIKNSGKNSYQMGASSNRVSVKTNLLDNHYRKIPVVEAVDDIEEDAYSTTVPPRGTIKYSSYKTKEQLFENLANRDRSKYENLELLKIKKRLTTTTTEPYVPDTRISASSVEEEDEEEEEEGDESTTVLGLVPPVPNKYTTIYTKPLSKESKMNLFYVLGMKPPSPKQKVYVYSDFKRPSKSKYRRGKRSAQRPAYSDVVRNRNKPIDVDDETEVVVEDDDDYVPHRPKNYHYDEKTGRIVYDKVEKDKEALEEEYIEVTEAPIPKPTRRNSVTTVKFEEFTGPSYVEYIKKLKSNPNYVEITDPPPTEKGEDATTTSTTTAKPIPTDPPEFLSVLAKIRSDSNYKAIHDKTTSKSTTTEAAEVLEDEEETQVENVQNSPGGQSSGQGFQIFDINEYLPKVKNYSPRTSIDYSKYKTIERAHVPLRHNMSSRYNSDEEDVENVRTSKVPILLDEKKKEENLEINPVMSESKREEVEPTTTTTTTTTTEPSISPSTKRRTRPKSRGTRRSTTISPTTTSTFTDESVAVHNKAKRVYPRRRPSRIKLNRTTTEVPDSELEESASAKVVRRRHQKSEDLPPKVEERIDKPDEDISEKNKTHSTTALKKDGDVQVFQKYDQKKQHGGSYAKEEESETKKVDDVKRLTDVVAKPSSYFTDPKLPKKINQLVEGKGGGVEEDSSENEEKEDGEETEFDYEGSDEKATTEKPFFVKDPDKRLYYYAPI